jgi:hypothetical protein
MEPRFGHDFGNVRIHTDAKAARSAQATNALAYTVGHDIVMDDGRYAPRSTAGRHLLAHELTHVLQQRGAPRPIVQRQDADDSDKNAAVPAPVANNDALAQGNDTPAQNDDMLAQNDAAGDGGNDAVPTGPGPARSIPSCDRRIFAEGTCEFLATHAGGRCCDPDHGISVPDKSTDVEGKPCPDHKFTPVFTCDHDCDTARTKGCSDSDNWMAVPRNQFGKIATTKCGQIWTICANGRKTTGYVRDKSVTNDRFEVSPGIQSILGVSGTFNGAIYHPGADPAKIDRDPCCNSAKK